MTSILKASLGSISHGTMRSEDLLNTFANEIEYHVQRNAAAWCSDDGRKHRDELMKLVSDAREVTDFDSEEAQEIVNEMFDALHVFAPDYCSFCANEGDGSDYGFWPDMGSIDDLPRIGDHGEHPASMAVDLANAFKRGDFDEAKELIRKLSDCECIGEDCAFVNDHGNVTIYGADGTVLIDFV